MARCGPQRRVEGFDAMTDHLIVAIVAVISGGFAIPVGFLLDLPAIETYLAAAAGALLGMFVFVFIGAGLRE